MAHIDDRLQRLRDNRIDWSTAEAMALGSLLYQGFNVRLSGQDVGRGTFSHRHVMLVDQDSDTAHIPLNSLTESQTNFIEVMMGTKILWAIVLNFCYGFFDFEKDINFCVVIVCKYLHLYALVTIMSGFIF